MAHQKPQKPSRKRNSSDPSVSAPISLATQSEIVFPPNTSIRNPDPQRERGLDVDFPRTPLQEQSLQPQKGEFRQRLINEGFLPQPGQAPTDEVADQRQQRVEQQQLQHDRTNFAIRQRADARRRQRLGLPPRQLGALPPLRTFARIRDASQISDAQIPGGVPTLNAPVEQINPDNLQDNQVYRTVDDRFVRFNAEDGSFTDMVFNPRGGPNQEGAFEIDVGVPDAVADLSKAQTTEFANSILSNFSDQFLSTLDPTLAKSIRSQLRLIESLRDSDISDEQIVSEILKANTAIQRSLPQETEPEATETTAEAWTDKYVFPMPELGPGVISYNDKLDGTGTQKLFQAKPPLKAPSVPISESPSPIHAWLNENRDEWATFVTNQKTFAAHRITRFTITALQAALDDKKVRKNIEDYLTANLSSLPTVLQPIAANLVRQKLAQTIEDEVPPIEFTIELDGPLASSAATDLFRELAMEDAQKEFKMTVEPGLPPPRATPQPAASSPGGTADPTENSDGFSNEEIVQMALEINRDPLHTGTLFEGIPGDITPEQIRAEFAKQ